MATGDHGNPRCGAADPASASRSHSPEGSGTSPEKRLRRKRLRGRRTGPRHGRLRAGAGALGRSSVSVLGVGPPSCRPRVNPSDSQSVLPRVYPSRRTARLSLADCGCQAVLEPSSSREPQPITALLRGASGPRRGATRQVPEPKGESAGRAQAWRGGDPPRWTGSRPALQGPVGLGGKAGLAIG